MEIKKKVDVFNGSKEHHNFKRCKDCNHSVLSTRVILQEVSVINSRSGT